MKNAAQPVVITIVFLIIIYLMFALLGLSFRPRNWADELRVYWKVISGLCIIVALGVYQMIIFEDNIDEM